MDQFGPIIPSAWSDCLNHIIEPRHTYSSSQARPDIIVQNVFEFDVELDVSIAHPWCPDIMLNVAQSSGSAALRREEKKKETYSSETHPSGSNPNVVLLVFEYFGHLG